MNASIPADEAKIQFLELLGRVASGEEITITQHEQPVAKIVPAPQKRSRNTQALIKKIEQIRQPLNPPGMAKLTIKQLIEEGRRR